ncbi:hypothetical protein Tco_0925233 [Tanacetum coccineum]|uniref:Uncharacterized protein n=1 Tax=Tanacetum coccineum TaxID=301880 RepID=A0ABQ5DCF7_9ASTR
MDSESAHMVVASKVPMLKPGKFKLWWMRIEQYIQMIDYALWEVIENGNTAPKTTVVEGVEKVIPPTTAEEKGHKRLKVKARSTLMMGIPNEHQLKLNSIKDAKLLLEGIEKRFGGNAATKKTQRNLLKQQYENFIAHSSKTLDQTFDRLQKLVSQLEILGETLSQEEPELETMSMDDLYNSLKVYEPEVKGTSSSNTSIQNMAFVSSNNSGSTNEAVNTAHGVSAVSTQVSAANSINVDNLSDVVIYDLEEMDLRWQMAMLTMRARRFLKNTRRRVTVHGNESIVDMTGVIRHRKDLLTMHSWLTHLQVLVLRFDKSELMVVAYKTGEITIRELRKKLEIVQKEKDDIKFNVDKFENVSKSLNKIIESQIVDNCKKGLSYNVVPPPLTGNFMPPKPDLSFTGLEEFTNKPVVIKHVIENNEANASEAKPKAVRKNNGAPIIEDWVSDSEEENVSQTKIEKKTAKPSFVKIDFSKAKQTNKTNRKLLNKLSTIGETLTFLEAIKETGII